VAKTWKLLLTGGHMVHVSNSQKAIIIDEVSSIMDEGQKPKNYEKGPLHKILHLAQDGEFPDLHVHTDTFVAVQGVHDNVSST
jgi:hypothetical protein